MLPGPDLIKKCCACGALSKQLSIASGNTAGARYWTDGYWFAPMLPQTPQLVTCPHCNETGWQSDFTEVDRCPDRTRVFFLMQDFIESESPPDAIQGQLSLRERYKGLPHLEEASPEAIAKFIKGSTLSFKKEVIARTVLWQRWNDERRGDPGRHPLNQDELDNLERLRALLASNEDARYTLRAEISRQLGRFEEAKNLLSKVKEGTKGELTRRIILDALESGDRHLRVIA